MIWHDSQALSHLGQLTSDEMERAVRDTRRATLLTTQATDLERTLHFRYAVLGTSASWPAISSSWPVIGNCSAPISSPYRMPRSMGIPRPR